MAYRLLVIALLVFAIAYTIAARNIPMDVWTAAETVNTQTLPTIYGSLLAVVLITLLLRTSRTRQSTPSPRSSLWIRLIGLSVTVALFILALPVINVWIALGLLIGGSAWWLGERRWLPLLLCASVVPIVGFLGIEQLLDVYIP